MRPKVSSQFNHDPAQYRFERTSNLPVGYFSSPLDTVKRMIVVAIWAGALGVILATAFSM